MKSGTFLPLVWLVLVATLLHGPVLGQSPTAAMCDAPVHTYPRPVTLSPLLTGLETATFVTPAGDGSGRLFITEKRGVVHIFHEGRLLREPFLDLSDRVDAEAGTEKGLLSIAFHPDFPNDDRFFVVYSDATAPRTVLAEHRVGANPDRAQTEGRVLLTIPQFGDNRLHKGGQAMFGSDGFLYLSAGDAQERESAQDRSTLTGSISRIDVDRGDPYGIPDSNPFVDEEGVRPEIWAYGLRNPWRFSFDACSGTMYIGDVGDFSFEEIDIGHAGGNYGWPILEGRVCRTGDQCGAERFIAPLHAFGHIGIDPDGGNAVVGGYVYRGTEYPSLAGRYLFADFATGRIWSATETISTDAAGEFSIWTVDEIAVSDDKPTSFGQDEDGTLLLLTLGGLYEIVPARLTFGSLIERGVSFLDAALTEEGIFVSSNWDKSQIDGDGARFRWGYGPQSEVQFELEEDRALSLNLQMTSPIPGQIVVIEHNGEAIGTTEGSELRGRWLSMDLFVPAVAGVNRLVFRYADWNGNVSQVFDNANWPAAVKFRDFSFEPFEGYAGGSLMTLEPLSDITVSGFTRARSLPSGQFERWGFGPSSAMTFNLGEDRDLLLDLRFRSPVEEQRMTIIVNGEIAAQIDGRFDGWREETIPIPGSRGQNRIELEYAGWNGNPTLFRPSDDRKHAVQFQEIALSFVESDTSRGTEPVAVTADPVSAELGRSVYGNCVGCHQADGRGIPDLYPPLAGHTADIFSRDGGREYLINVLLYGVEGEIQVDGGSYNGAMPAWGHLSDEDIAAVLNHLLTGWTGEEVQDPVSAGEVARARRTPLDPAAVSRLRQRLGLGQP